MRLFRLDPHLQAQLVNTYLDTIPLVMFNVLWLLTSLPLITIFPATAGLFYATNRLAHDQPVEWRDYFRGMRRYFWQSWGWGALNMIAGAIVFSNNVYYAQNPSVLAGLARIMVLTFGLFWISVQTYCFPLLMEQEKPRLDLALRNSLVILLKRPLFSLGMALYLTVIAFFSTAFIWPVWCVITAAFCARAANAATIKSIEKIRTSTSTPGSPA